MLQANVMTKWETHFLFCLKSQLPNSNITPTINKDYFHVQSFLKKNPFVGNHINSVTQPTIYHST